MARTADYTRSNKMYTRSDVLLQDGTTGILRTMPHRDPSTLIGTKVNVWAKDENGKPLEVRGVLVEIL